MTNQTPKNEVRFLFAVIALFFTLFVVQAAKAQDNGIAAPHEDFSDTVFNVKDIKGAAKEDRDEAYIFMVLYSDLCPDGEIELMIATWPEFYIDEIVPSNTCYIDYTAVTYHEDTTGYLADYIIARLQYGYMPLASLHIGNMTNTEFWQKIHGAHNAGIEELYERDRLRAMTIYTPMIATAGATVGTPPTQPQ